MERDIRVIKLLNGFSGCKVLLCQGKGKYFVRKISKSKEYNFRLKIQMEKQKFFFENVAGGRISTPQVMGEGSEKGLFYFDMDYIDGISLVEKIYNSRKEEIEELAKVLLSTLNLIHKVKSSKEEINLEEKFTEKIKSISSSINKEEKTILIQIMTQFKGLPVLKKTFCHGDFTLENVIYNKKDGKYYLIDFLDSFVDHSWMDVAKLFQDIEGEWFLLRNPLLDKRIMKIKNDFLKEIILKSKGIREGYSLYNKPFFLMTFARILPYANKKEEKEFIKERLLKKLTFN